MLFAKRKEIFENNGEKVAFGLIFELMRGQTRSRRRRRRRIIGQLFEFFRGKKEEEEEEVEEYRLLASRDKEVAVESEGGKAVVVVDVLIRCSAVQLMRHR